MKSSKKIYPLRVDFPDCVLSVVEHVQALGAEAFITGGALRDALLGRSSVDVDVATSLHFSKLQEIFPADQIMVVLPEYFCIKLRFSDVHVDVTSYRTEGGYHDHRRPTEVYPASQEEDAKRRDLTMNALYYDPGSHQIIDYFGGLDDLFKYAQVRLIRSVDSLKEDYLRILRCVRFSLQCGLGIEKQTLADLWEARTHILEIEPDRFRQEMAKCLESASLREVLEAFDRCGVLEVFGVQQFGKGPSTREHWIHQVLLSLESLEPGACGHRDLLLVMWVLRQESDMDRAIGRLIHMMRISQKDERQIKKAYAKLHAPTSHISNFHPPPVFDALARIRM